MINPFLYIKEFGFTVFFSKVIRSQFYGKNTGLSEKICAWNEVVEKKFLIRNVVEKIDLNALKEQSQHSADTMCPNIIWVMWWQGEANAPKVVRACIDSIRRNANGRTVILLDQNNYSEYVPLNDKIRDRIQKRQISKTHISDIIRCALLSRYGGMWIDATVYVTKPIPKNISDEYTFFTIRTGGYTTDPSHGRWTTFYMFAQPQTLLFLFVDSVMQEYFKHYKHVFDYVLQDYVISLASDLLPECLETLELVPINNQHTFDLRPRLGIVGTLDSAVYDDTFLYKLTWKAQFPVQDENGKYTVYADLIGRGI